MALTDKELYLLEDRADYAKRLLQWHDMLTEMYGRVSMLQFETGTLKQIRLDGRVFSSKLIDEADEMAELNMSCRPLYYRSSGALNGKYSTRTVHRFKAFT